MDQILERFTGKSYYYFLDEYSGYNQIVITLEDQEKTTFTCLFGTNEDQPNTKCNHANAFLEVPIRPIIRVRAKKFKKALNGLI
jgi:hypothetical protein